MGLLVPDVSVTAELGVLAVVSLITLLLALYLLSPHPRPAADAETVFKDALTGEYVKFPSLVRDLPSVTLSVVVPAYNETVRLPVMLTEALAFLDTRCQEDGDFTYEVIIVDDGSTDDTTSVAQEFAEKHARNSPKNEIRVMRLCKNRGKGGAVTQGMLAARGKRLLFADADGATRFSDLDLLESSLAQIMEDDRAVAIGSRAHMVKSEAVVKRSALRNFLMHGFHAILFLVGISSIKDTQCGFKLLSRDAARVIFPNMHSERWIFDIELLLVAIDQRIPISEIPVNWHEVQGSKVSLVKDSFIMLMDLLVIRLNYAVGFWRVQAPDAKKS
ncbi:dolichyl-phosphate beta-glucosyltransferase [Gaertneriomyces sp. JEL0708]|nr:dolichyl-phosphate beta-glucosyltransferase [Gaertneriomyces sp. JEL0708]